MAAWILAAFIMTQLYNAQLFNYIMTSVPVPIVNSAEELADNPNFDLVVADGFSPDLTIRVRTYNLNRYYLLSVFP